MKKSRGRRPHDLKGIARRAMEEHGFLTDWSREARTAVERMRAAASAPGSRDLRSLAWCSIDNDDSLDLDQLTVAEELAGGAAKVLVAIADVDEVVPRGSVIDRHAEHNTTSVYTAAATFPMLPERLSTDLTSLSEGEDRAAVVVEMIIGKDGSVGGSTIYRALVRNRAKLAYNGIASWLEGGIAPPKLAAVAGLDGQVRLQDRLARGLADRRARCGALSLQTVEARPVFKDGVLAGLESQQHNRATRIIEDFMIAANEATVGYLRQQKIPAVRRVLRSPERWQRIVELAARAGADLPPEPDSAALEDFLRERRAAEPEGFADLSLTVVKLMGKGEYAAVSPGGSVPGHFGLAVSDYAHSTAPNRRFPDVITQRLLKAALDGRSVPYSGQELERIAFHCTVMEDAAKKVERLVLKSAAAVILEGRVGATFEAIVTGASPKGTWVRIFDPPVEGKLLRGFNGLDVGDRVTVRLLGTDVDRGFIDFVR